MPSSPDVIVVGGGIAGSAVALLLGRAGVQVELYERGSFPREKPCGEGLMPVGVAALERMGLLETVGGAPFVGVRYHVGRMIVPGRFPTVEGRAVIGLGQRRWHLDKALFDEAARTPGVSARVCCPVGGPVLESGRVVGCEVAGEERRSPLVIAADGLHSRIRRRVGLDASTSKRIRVGIRTHFRLARGKEQPPWVEVFLGHRYELYVTPLPDHELLVAGLAERDALRGPADEALSRWIHVQPVLSERLRGAQQITRVEGRSPLGQSARAGVVRGLVLLGDAAGFTDPITGGGMAQALLSAELLAEHVVRGLGKGEDWLWHFEADRRVMLRDYRLLTQFVLTLAANPSAARLALGLLGLAPPAMSHLVGVAGGVRSLRPGGVRGLASGGVRGLASGGVRGPAQGR